MFAISTLKDEKKHIKSKEIIVNHGKAAGKRHSAMGNINY